MALVNESPERIGPYEIRGRLGAGGMGVVYLGWDPRLDRSVAVKTLRSERVQDIDARDRFLKEARAVAAVSHPNVTQIHDIGEQDGSIWFAMEYLEGIALDRMLAEQGPLTAERAVDFVRQAARGLEAAAERGIIHRDIKPGNLVLSADGKLKVTDFGLAKHTAADTDVTSSTVFIGTPDYIAPERAAGDPVDLRSDIYSLGATFYELVTGQPPFSGPNPVAVISKHLRDSVPPPREIRSGLSYPLNLLILRMLSKDPARRPQDYGQLVRQLDRLPVETTKVESVAAAVAAAPPARRSRAGLIAAGVAVALVAVVIVSRFTGSAADVAAPDPGTTTQSDCRGALPPAAPILTPVTGSRVARSQLAQQRAELTVVQNVSEITTDGRMRVLGQVKNVGDGRAVEGRIRIAVLDGEGREVDATEVPLAPPTLGPGELANFDAILPGDVPTGMIKLDLSWVS